MCNSLNATMLSTHRLSQQTQWRIPRASSVLQSHCLLYCFSSYCAQQCPSWSVSSLKPCVPSSSDAQTSAWPPLCLLHSGRCPLLLRWGARLGYPPGYPPAQSAWATFHPQAYIHHSYIVSNVVGNVVTQLATQLHSRQHSKQHSYIVSNTVSIVDGYCNGLSGLAVAPARLGTPPFKRVVIFPGPKDLVDISASIAVAWSQRRGGRLQESS
jgi:hypothetical protein